VRTETVVTQKAWYPFGKGLPGIPERKERRVLLSKQEVALLTNAQKLLARLRKAVDPEGWNDWYVDEVASAETYVRSVVDFFTGDDVGIPVDEDERLVNVAGRMIEVRTMAEWDAALAEGGTA
jgi:hypothetical protein